MKIFSFFSRKKAETVVTPLGRKPLFSFPRRLTKAHESTERGMSLKIRAKNSLRETYSVDQLFEVLKARQISESW